MTRSMRRQSLLSTEGTEAASPPHMGEAVSPARSVTRSMRRQSMLSQESKEPESPVASQKKPSRKSMRKQVSNVPDVLSEWFSPRNSGTVVDSKEVSGASSQSKGKGKTRAKTGVNGHVSSQHEAVTPLPVNGFSTPLAYFTPLSRLDQQLNPSSQQSHGANTIDILAVITDHSKDPVRAKTGPKDYFTIFSISDPSITMADNTRVEVYRPYKATLPVAEVGDVVLLRNFVVKSRKRTPYLLSTDSSAWCVWRYPDENNEGRPAWATRGAAGGIKEEVKVPPVELGEEERRHARGLRAWWAAESGNE